MIPFGQISEGPFVGMITPFIAIVGVHFVCDIGGNDQGRRGFDVFSDPK